MALLFNKLHKPLYGFNAARNPKVSTDFRLFLLVAERLMSNGHAPFKERELAEALGKDGSTVRRAMAALVKAGVFLPDSDAMCVMVNPEYVTADLQYDRRECPKHGAGDAKAYVHPNFTDRAREIREKVDQDRRDESQALLALRALGGPRWWELWTVSHDVPDVPPVRVVREPREEARIVVKDRFARILRARSMAWEDRQRAA
ncbi:hypothetical protein H9Y04_06575 [Streptomyces sp. TRM66268-LWL]|uniref:HTH iclR-type domain-containing protein n=1 Tax=Streptomyces polyasparticus TaxID=2767826 RepID=A0ABR7S9S3_9ACTN|nr:winged helix-turn-helix domain-containing protein [Streptomyces polyasparticus]MBC9712236.1 hypothetical protein [Streptomyces polyasparticus]